MALIQKNINWKPYEVIYSAGDEPDGLYPVSYTHLTLPTKA